MFQQEERVELHKYQPVPFHALSDILDPFQNPVWLEPVQKADFCNARPEKSSTTVGRISPQDPALSFSPFFSAPERTMEELFQNF
jgi:hypothetical protein